MKFFTPILFSLVLGVSVAQCAPAEFVASAENFRGYRDWPKIGPVLMGAGPMGAALGGAHGATDNTIRRTIFTNRANLSRTAGQFAIGTVIIKLTENADGSVERLLAMTKRGNGFNSANNGWEWFFLDASGAISTRGGDIALCNGCHSGARDRDFVFSVP